MFKLGLNCKSLNNLPTSEKMIAACCLLIIVVNDDLESLELFLFKKNILFARNLIF